MDAAEALPGLLAGRRVARVEVSRGEEYLRLGLDDGKDVVISGVGDCCSETWFADITGFDALAGKVTAVEMVDLPKPKDDDGRSRQSEDQFYGIKFTTDRGRCDVVFRNSSNGYYGGYALVVDSVPSHCEMVSVTQDWSAGGTRG